MAEVKFNVKEKEIWKDCTYPTILEGAYQINSNGDIFDISKHKILKQKKSSDGYMEVELKTESGNKIKVRSSNLVTWEFSSSKFMEAIMSTLVNN